jgi:hypothetical protein
VRYPLKEGNIEDTTAKAVSAAIKGPIGALAEGDSPVFGSIKGYPANPDPTAASTMKRVMTATAAFQGEISAVRALPRNQRMARAKELVAKYWKPPFAPPTALALLLLLKNCAEDANDWNWITDFITQLPAEVADQEEVRELEAFALDNAGKPIDAIARLEALIAQFGPSPERLGLLGGRHKRLYTTAAAPADATVALNKAIDAYERGMELDLNEYYCSSNLPRLYKVRKRKGDDERALSVSKIVIAACERARKLGAADDWLRATLLGAAFDSGDAEKAEELAYAVAIEGLSRWKIDSILADLKASAAQVEDKDHRDRLAAILRTLGAVV